MDMHTPAALLMRPPLKAHYDNWIGGRWVPAKSGATFDNVSPLTGWIIES